MANNSPSYFTFTLVSGNGGDEKHLPNPHPPPGRQQIYFFNRFSGDILFCSLVYFAFLIFLFFLLVCFLKLKIYILIHIRLCRHVSNKKFFTRPICGNKTTFFWPRFFLIFISHLKTNTVIETMYYRLSLVNTGKSFKSLYLSSFDEVLNYLNILDLF